MEDHGLDLLLWNLNGEDRFHPLDELSARRGRLPARGRREDALVRPDGKELLRIGLHQVEKMRGLIGEILSAFAREVGPLLPTPFTPDNTSGEAGGACF